MDVLEGAGLVALRDAGGGARPIGLATWFLDPAVAEAEVRVLLVAAEARGQGVGRTLLGAAARALREVGVRRAWLVTTNDNLAALALYQKAGWRLSALRAGAVELSRRTIKPGMPELGEHGIPLRDELELAIEL